MKVLTMKFRPLSLCWFLANQCADDAFRRNPSVPRSTWLRLYLPRPVVISDDPVLIEQNLRFDLPGFDATEPQTLDIVARVPAKLPDAK